MLPPKRSVMPDRRDRKLSQVNSVRATVPYRNLSVGLRFGITVLLIAAAIFLPRLPAYNAGVALWEDWDHPPAAHLQSYRPMAAAELALMQVLFGSNYLSSAAPWIMATVYLAVGLTLLVALLRSWGVQLWISVALVLLLVLHPMFNEFLIWHVLSSSWIALPLMAGGVVLCLRKARILQRALGLVLIALAGMVSQVAVMLPTVLILGEAVARGERHFRGLERAEWFWRLGAILVAPMSAMIALLLLRLGLGYADFADRGLGVGVGSFDEWLRAKFYVYSNAVANVYQAPLAYIAGKAIALSAFWWFVATIASIATLIAVLIKATLTDRLLIGYAVPVAFLVMLLPLLATSATPSGYRIISFASFACWFVSCAALSHLVKGAAVRSVYVVLVAFAGGVFYSTSAVDVEVRQFAFERDTEWRTDLINVLQASAVTELTVCEPQSFQVTKADPANGIIVSYNRLTIDSYSNLVNLPAGFLSSERFPVKFPAQMGSNSTVCSGTRASVSPMSVIQLESGLLAFSENGRRVAIFHPGEKLGQ